uniref:Chromosomal protein MC1 domain-containing protein n=1 Tax=Mimivirus LCMiAC02 TaxID=2506609 RepID=A0A481Z1L7_9VIRU|nr:MAG: uncharacterized protein LCMiAC02_01540 [Mimivirus LCMiAC02]
MSKKKTRYFKLVYDAAKGPCGRFSCTYPKAAANKAFASILKKSGDPNNLGEVSFCMVECTSSSNYKKYFYIGERQALAVPIQVTIGNGPDAKVIIYKYQTKIKKDIQADKAYRDTSEY